MASAVQLREAVALAGRFPLLAGVDLEVGYGEAVHLRGPNGAGKTSILRVCAGLVPLVGGSAVVLGHDLRRDRRSVRREVGLIGHSTALYEELTVEDNLRFALRAARAPEEGAVPALGRLGLAGRLARTRVGDLSAGQRRRAALAVLFARSPRLLLLDEPHAGLDDGAREVLDAEIASALGRGCTVVVASHEEEGRALGGIGARVVMVAGGRVAASHPAAPERQTEAVPVNAA